MFNLVLKVLGNKLIITEKDDKTGDNTKETDNLVQWSSSPSLVQWYKGKKDKEIGGEF